MKGKRGSSVTIRDTGYKRAVAGLGKMNGVHVTVGVHETEGSKAYEDGATVADVAAFHVYGTATIPPRDFIAGYVNEDRGAIAERSAAAARAVLRGMDPELAARILAEHAVSGMKQFIRAGIPPDLKSRDGTPLIDTGQLIGAIGAEIK